MLSSRNIPIIAGSGLVLGFLLLWELSAARSVNLSFAVSRPSEIAHALYLGVTAGPLLSDAGITVVEAVAGFLIGVGGGTLVGLSLWLSPTAAAITRPFVVAFGSIPVLVFAPMLILICGVGLPLKIFCAALSTFFVSLFQAYRGAQVSTAEQLDFVAALGAPRRRVFRKLVVPGAVDWVAAGLRLNIGFALLGAFIGEVIASNSGLGRRIIVASSLYDVPTALAAALCMGVVALGADFIGQALERRGHDLASRVSVAPATRRFFAMKWKRQTQMSQRH